MPICGHVIGNLTAKNEVVECPYVSSIYERANLCHQHLADARAFYKRAGICACLLLLVESQ